MISLEERIRQFDKIVKMTKEAQEALTQYFFNYKLYASFEYWMMIAILIAPLIFILIKIDKKKILQIGMYGYGIHVFISYLDLFGRNSGYWNYPFPLIPALPGLSLDSSLIPVSYMLMYQWTIKRNKNYYIYAILLSGGFAFVFKPLIVGIGLFKLYGINYFHILIIYIIPAIMSKLITDFFLWLQKKYG